MPISFFPTLGAATSADAIRSTRSARFIKDPHIEHAALASLLSRVRRGTLRHPSLAVHDIFGANDVSLHVCWKREFSQKYGRLRQWRC